MVICWRDFLDQSLWTPWGRAMYVNVGLLRVLLFYPSEKHWSAPKGFVLTSVLLWLNLTCMLGAECVPGGVVQRLPAHVSPRGAVPSPDFAWLPGFYVLCLFLYITQIHPLRLHNGWPKIRRCRIWKSTKSCKNPNNLKTYIRSILAAKRGGGRFAAVLPLAASIEEM